MLLGLLCFLMTLQVCLGLYDLDTLKGGCSEPGNPSSYKFFVFMLIFK